MVNAPTGETRLGPTEQVQALDRDCTTLLKPATMWSKIR